jgi:hypothetical protein
MKRTPKEQPARLSRKDRKVLLKSQQGEYDAVKKYESVVPRFPETGSVKDDEQHHGDAVLALLED